MSKSLKPKTDKTMMIDLVLQMNDLILKVNKKLLENESFPLTIFQDMSSGYLKHLQVHLGRFCLDKPGFGLDGCFQKVSEDEEYVIYKSSFPEMTSKSADRPAEYWAIRRVLVTTHLLTHDVADLMYYDRQPSDENSWADQGLTLNIMSGGRDSNNFSIGGQIYPWFKRKLHLLDDDNLSNLNEYVLNELNRVHKYLYGEEISYHQISIMRSSFFIQVSMNGRWVAWDNSRKDDKPEEFSSHNIDNSVDQTMCFIGLLAMNTWLRNK